ncbi:hypothetical protein BDZ45DRAFT_749341 [Acephala macrosclerotiorum]|nr:hypothetical protein BDZ45DRAFT_749341 [Acephala macrosclerotiorum]
MKSPYDFSLKQCAGILSLIKSRPLEKMPLGTDIQFWIQVDRFLYFASSILLENLTEMLELVDEFDRTCAIIAKRNSGLEFPSLLTGKKQHDVQYLELGQWVAAHPLGRNYEYPRTHILSLAVGYGIIGYVENRVKHRCLVQMHRFTASVQGAKMQSLPQLRLGVDYLHPLLLDAVVPPHSLPIPQHSLGIRRSLNPEMVLCLLKKDADPNYPVQSSLVEWVCFGDQSRLTVWECAIREPPFALIPNESRSSLYKTWKLMLEYGAGHFSHRVTQELILGLEKRELHAQLNWLLEVQRRGVPKRKWFNWK